MSALYTDRLNGLSGDLAIKAPCRAATTANITLSGTQTIDGVAVVADDRVLVKNQTSSVDNGIWIAGSGAWTRALDFNGSRDAVGGTMVLVVQGTTNSNSYWRVDGIGAKVIATDALTFSAAFVDDSATSTFLQAGTGADATTVQAKLREVSVSITDWSAVAGNTGDQASKIQETVNAVRDAGGGFVDIPPGTFRITAAITLYSNVTIRLFGNIHMVNTTTLNAFQATGTSGARLTNINVIGCGGKVYGDATFAAGVPSVTNGSAFNFAFVDRSSVKGVTITGFADNAVAFANGDYNLIEGNTVDACGQSLAFYGTTRDNFGNRMIGNTVSNNGTYNALHSEGNASGGTKKCYGVVIAGNTVDDSYGHCINVENSPEASVTGNCVRKAGPGTGAALIHGIFVYGSPNCSITGNDCTGSDGYGIVIGAGSSGTAVSGNSTSGNAGSILVTDGNSVVTGTAATNNIAMGINALDEADIVTAGNFSFRNRIQNLKFSNVAVADSTTLDWYEEGSFTPVAQGTGAAGTGTYTLQLGRFTRIGNLVHFEINLGWSAHTGTTNLQITGLPYAGSATVVQPVTIWSDGLAVTAGQILQASIPQSGSLINIQTYADTSGNNAALAIDTVVAGLHLSGTYRV